MCALDRPSQSTSTYVTSALLTQDSGTGIVAPDEKLRLGDAKGPAPGVGLGGGLPARARAPPRCLLGEAPPAPGGMGPRRRRGEPAPSSCREAPTTGSTAGALPPHLADKARGCSPMKYLRACQVNFRSTQQHAGHIIPSTAASPGRPLTELGAWLLETGDRAQGRPQNLPPPRRLP